MPQTVSILCEVFYFSLDPGEAPLGAAPLQRKTWGARERVAFWKYETLWPGQFQMRVQWVQLFYDNGFLCLL